MIFETYKYDDGNQDARNAVANNGFIQINFHKEFVPVRCTFYNNTTFTTDCNIGTYSILKNEGVMGDVNESNNIGEFIYNTSYNQTSVSNSGNIGLGITSPGINLKTSDLSFKSNESKVELKSSKKLSKSLKETGRVEKGEKSDQKFKNVDIQFETFAFHTIQYHLKPMSEQYSNTKEVREYCNQCHYRIRNNNWIYCPKCGEKL
jgi:Zn finger protein HypA/HybF involved in hydrogenase expression